MWEDWDDRLIISFYTSTHGEGIDDDEVQQMFYEGWINSDNTPDERFDARQEFMDWMEEAGYDVSDFDWEDWRDWYDAA